MTRYAGRNADHSRPIGYLSRYNLDAFLRQLSLRYQVAPVASTRLRLALALAIALALLLGFPFDVLARGGSGYRMGPSSTYFPPHIRLAHREREPPIPHSNLDQV